MINLKEQIRKSFEPFTGKKIDKNLISALHETIKSILNDYIYDDYKHIEFNIKTTEDNKIELKPKNLFTAITLLGVDIPYSMIKNQEAYFIDGLGEIKKDDKNNYSLFKMTF